MRKLLHVTLAFVFWAGLANAETLVRFGVITDVHHTNKPDIKSHKYSASLAKTAYFVDIMSQERADFIIELGDFIDTLANGKDPVQNLNEVEDIFSSFAGSHYHVLGNHEFDNIEREDLLPRLNNTDIPVGATYYSFDQNGVHCIVLDADYTVAEPHRPFDRQDPARPFWNWRDAWIPQEELDWLAADLAASNAPTLVFVHQALHRDVAEDHAIKNAPAIRRILENDGQVLAVFSGHDHRGEIAFSNGIHYFILEGNVGTSRDWSYVSPTEGLDPEKDNPFTSVSIKEKTPRGFSGMKTYELYLIGNGQQYSFEDQIQIVKP